MTGAVPDDAPALGLLAACQDGFPLVARPFDVIGRLHGLDEDEVLAELGRLRAAGVLSRIGAVWDRGAGGAGGLCALRVPPRDLARVAAIVNAEPAVNHNYQREHAWNLWYVLSAPDEAVVQATLRRIDAATGLASIHLPMVRPYRLDLAFDPRDPLAPRPLRGAGLARPLPPADRPLAALAEAGLALAPRPFDLWAAALGCTSETVLATLQRWRHTGSMRRFGAVVRHHELGYRANAMTVIEAPPARVDGIGAALAVQPGVTLAYRRRPARDWPYNLYFMVHGRERAAVRALVAAALAGAGARDLPHETLFSAHRFKQAGTRYFTETAA